MFSLLPKDLQREILFYLKDKHVQKISCKVLDDEDDYYWKKKYQDFIHKYIKLQEIVDLYLNKKNLPVTNKYYYESLCYEKYLCITGPKTLIRTLLKDVKFLTRHINTKDDTQRTLLTRICMEIKNNGKDKEYLDALKELVERSPDLNVKDWTGRTIIHNLVCEEHLGTIEALEILLNAGADVNLLDDEEIHPLTTSLQYKTYEMFKMLISSGANVNYQDKDGMSILMSAVMRSRTKAFDLLIEAGVDINAKDKHGYTVLHYAVKKDRSFVERLLFHSALVDATNNDDETPLYIAIENKDKQLVELLLKHGADMNYPIGGDFTPLTLAEATDQEIYQLMLNQGFKAT